MENDNKSKWLWRSKRHQPKTENNVEQSVLEKKCDKRKGESVKYKERIIFK
jgi:hypothetical protein